MSAVCVLGGGGSHHFIGGWNGTVHVCWEEAALTTSLAAGMGLSNECCMCAGRRRLSPFHWRLEWDCPCVLGGGGSHHFIGGWNGTVQ